MRGQESTVNILAVDKKKKIFLHSGYIWNNKDIFYMIKHMFQSIRCSKEDDVVFDGVFECY